MEQEETKSDPLSKDASARSIASATTPFLSSEEDDSEGIESQDFDSSDENSDFYENVLSLLEEETKSDALSEDASVRSISREITHSLSSEEDDSEGIEPQDFNSSDANLNLNETALSLPDEDCDVATIRMASDVTNRETVASNQLIINQDTNASPKNGNEEITG
jgi:hypothetical protein